MKISGKYDPILLLLGDIFLFVFALWPTLLVRYAKLPSEALFYNHLVPFSILFAVWILIFFIAGLYEKHTTFFKKKLPETIFRVQIINTIFAAVFFFAIPFFSITPKTNLVIYLIISSLLIIFWRVYLFPLLRQRKKEGALLIGEGEEFEALLNEVNGGEYNLAFIEVINLKKISGAVLIQNIFSTLKDGKISTVVIDSANEKTKMVLPHLYKPAFSNTQFFNFEEVYEEIFDRIPLSSIDYRWFLKNKYAAGGINQLLKRVSDIFFSLIVGGVFFLLLPFIALFIKLEDGGKLFISQKRVGKKGAEIHVYKIRTMTLNDGGSGSWVKEHGKNNTVTNVGKFLRKTSIDELPQFINVLRGEMSFIGPRSDIAGLSVRLSDEIPDYTIRHLVLPGITGWAQIKQRYKKGNISPQSIEESRVRFSYDLYYVKYNSIFLDLVIALKTIKTLLSRLI